VSVGVITAIFGGYDTLMELPANHGFDQSLCYTDNPKVVSKTWKVIQEPRLCLTPMLAAKQMKMLPHLYLGTEKSLWIDGAYQIRSPIIKTLVLKYLSKGDWVCRKHPHRDCLYDEGIFSTNLPRYAKHPIHAQLEHYRSQGVPCHFGLWSCGFIGRNHTKENAEFGTRWLLENMAWSSEVNDQICFPYLVWKFQKTITTLPLDSWITDKLIIHNSHKERNGSLV